MNNCKYSIGFTLLEVMISMVIFAVGILGLAGMQIVALENSFESASRNQAIILAYSMSDSIRANKISGDDYLLGHNDDIVDNSNCDNSNCSAKQIVYYDHGLWKKELRQSLISGNGEIIGAYPNYIITVRWDEDRIGATGTNCPIQSPDDLRCFQLRVRL